MPPKRAAKKQAPATPPLDGCIVALSGTFPGYSQPVLERDFIIPLGATLSKSVNDTVTHLVASDADYAKNSTKVKQAKSLDLPIVKLSWLQECHDQNKKLAEADYSLDTANGSAVVANGNGKALPSRKRNASVSLVFYWWKI